MWYSVYLNSQNIKKETDKAFLILIPRKSHCYGGWQFWHPKSCVRSAGHRGYRISLYWSSSWVFTVFKSRNSTVEISSEEMFEILGNPEEQQYFLNVVEPIKKEVVFNSPLDELTKESL